MFNLFVFRCDSPQDAELAHERDLDSLEQLMQVRKNYSPAIFSHIICLFQGYEQLKTMLASANDRIAEEEANKHILIQVRAACLVLLSRHSNRFSGV
jgi:hypothetical protein